jgi:hypothetical protein
MALSPSDNLITHKKVSSEVSPVNCGDWNANHDIKNLMGYILVEERGLPAGTTTTTFSNLDGDTDEEYLLEYIVTINCTDTDGVIFVRPNNLNSGYNCMGERWWDTTGDPVKWTTYFAFSRHGLTGQTLYQSGKCILQVKSGMVRFFKGRSICNGPTETLMTLSGGILANTTDNITNLVVGFDKGSFSGTIRLWKRIPVEV